MPKPAKNSPKKQTKTAFVLSVAHSVPAKDVVAKAKAAGMALTDKLVWAIRSDAKKRKSKGATKKTAAKKTGGKKTAQATPKKSNHAVNGHAAEELLRAVAAELGLSHAMSILKAEHDRVHRLLGG